MKAGALRWTTTAATLALLLLCVCGLQTTEGKQMAMRSLSAGEVYRMLRDAGREDAVPEGRIITQGLAAMSGFAVGLTKAIGGALLYDLIFANVTGTTPAPATNGTTQEVCFNSRQARSLEEAEAVMATYNKDDAGGNKGVRRVRNSEIDKRQQSKRRNKPAQHIGKRGGVRIKLVKGRRQTNHPPSTRGTAGRQISTSGTTLSTGTTSPTMTGATVGSTGSGIGSGTGFDTDGSNGILEISDPDSSPSTPTTSGTASPTTMTTASTDGSMGNFEDTSSPTATNSETNSPTTMTTASTDGSMGNFEDTSSTTATNSDTSSPTTMTAASTDGGGGGGGSSGSSTVISTTTINEGPQGTTNCIVLVNRRR